MKLAEACELLYLHFAVRAYEWLEQKRVRKQFYQDPLYKALDLALMKGPNPYRNKEAFPYGETPLCSLKKIADRFGLKSSDKVVDLGCGRGRGVFFLAQHYRCEVTGIDLVEPFIERARRFAKECQRLIPRSAEKVPFRLMRKFPRLRDRKASCIESIQRALRSRYKVSFMCQDMRKFDFSQATFVFFYGTTFSDEFVEELKVAMKTLPKGSKVVTVSYPLDGFKLIDQFSVSFNWGVADVYLLETTTPSKV